MNGSNAANESDAARDNLDPALLDRLVDGELAETERRKLLLSLDHQPSGWRQCALAFLEAQSWGDLLGVAADKTVTANTQTAMTETAAEAPAETSAEAPAAAAETVSLAVLRLELGGAACHGIGSGSRKWRPVFSSRFRWVYGFAAA